MEQGSAAMGRLPAPERRFPAMVADGAPRGIRQVIAAISTRLWTAWVVASTAAARHKVLHRVAGISSDIGKQHGGGNTGQIISLPAFRILTAGGRGDGSPAGSSVAASNASMVSASTFTLHARLFQTFALGMSPVCSSPTHSSNMSCPFDIRIPPA